MRDFRLLTHLEFTTAPNNLFLVMAHEFSFIFFIQVVVLRPVRHYADYHVYHTCQGEETIHRWANRRTGRPRLVDQASQQEDLDRQIETGRQTNRQKDRQTDRQTYKQADRQTGRQAGRQTDRQTD